ELAGIGEGAEELARRDAVGIGRRAILDERVRRAPDRPSLPREIDVPVASERGVSGPFVSRQRDEAARLVELGRQAIELAPELVRDLEIVALVRAGVDEGTVAGEGEILSRAAGSDRLLGLAVDVAPEM